LYDPSYLGIEPDGNGGWRPVNDFEQGSFAYMTTDGLNYVQFTPTYPLGAAWTLNSPADPTTLSNNPYDPYDCWVYACTYYQSLWTRAD
jgi:hypothetical protein